MRAAAATIVLALPSVRAPPVPRLPDTPTEISSNWLETISQIIGRPCTALLCNLTLNYLPSEHRCYYLSLLGSRALRWYQRFPGRLRVRDVAEVREDQQGETQHEALAARRTNFL